MLKPIETVKSNKAILAQAGLAIGFIITLIAGFLVANVLLGESNKINSDTVDDLNESGNTAGALAVYTANAQTNTKYTSLSSVIWVAGTIGVLMMAFGAFFAFGGRR